MRRARLVLIAVTTLLFAILIIAWIRSYTLGESIGVESRNVRDKVTRFVGVFSGGGQVAIGTLQVEYAGGRRGSPTWFVSPAVRRFWNWRRDFIPVPFMTETAHGWLKWLGVGRREIRQGNISRHVISGVGVPYWMPVIAAGAFPAWVLIGRLARSIRRSERGRLGKCLACGYDLRGATGERCPECGAPRGLFPLPSGEC